MTPIGILFRRGRERRKISQQDLADEMVFQQPFIARIEKGKACPHPKHAPAIARALRVSEQAVADAIFATKHPGATIGDTGRHGWFIPMTEDEAALVALYANRLGFDSPESLIQAAVTAFLETHRQ